ncbi:MAG: glycosyltransferase [Actinobacteria bacterium]|nr:glycosyltransferase [Actinomycetota bacterium]
MTSVIVPAHDEERRIGACLSALLDDARAGELEVVVVCNGCTDRTAEIARSFGQAVTVVETPIASKAHALVQGDRTATRYPRVYVDGDVVLDTAAVRALVGALGEPGILAVSPRPSYELDDVGWLVRSYHRIWQRLPGVRPGLVGSGVYGLSEEGRGRFGRFPDVLGDDLFVQELFEPAERIVVDGAVSKIDSARSVRELIRRKIRVFAGNREHAERYRSGQSVTRWTGCLEVVWRRPGLIVDLPGFVIITALAKGLAWWRYRRGTWRNWSGDGGAGNSSGQLSLVDVAPGREPRRATPARRQVPAARRSNDRESTS